MWVNYHFKMITNLVTIGELEKVELWRQGIITTQNLVFNLLRIQCRSGLAKSADTHHPFVIFRLLVRLF